MKEAGGQKEVASGSEGSRKPGRVQRGLGEPNRVIRANAQDSNREAADAETDQAKAVLDRLTNGLHFEGDLDPHDSLP